ncbi:polyadenylate-binding protein RBP47B'-like [Zingiber officinale]|uniref:polyadenylate-binding protein RBP47B'-like n=1 Tax=Zingiber officinale TaxID=94328 RepID=UPI001C4B1D56|nr:polyadenylate-binding protein RBP47B'-like [Zingiber officinale]XP_042462702.1 polyadenylate-binding protein RBP47B'-like [Zingiber officinale]
MDSSHQQQWHHQQGWVAAAPPTAATVSHGYHQPTTLEEVRSLWIGDLQYWVDENYLHSCFSHTGEVMSVKIIRNKITGMPEGYGFIEFVTHAAAERILQTYNGAQMPGTEQTFRLNWASFGIGERRPDAGPDHSIFVGDLAPDVTDYLLQETFRVTYPSVRGAKVVTDPNTGRSKGYGFVKFADEIERNRAMTEMNGVYCSSRPMRISAATPKKAIGIQPQYPAAKALYPATTYAVPQLPPVPPDSDITNTTIFVGCLDPNITEEELKQICIQFGEIIYVKIPAGKGCGFVQFVARAYAEEAIQKLHGTMIGQQIVRLSWGKSPASKQDPSMAWSQQADPTQWASAYYGYGYDPYAYGAAQDPSLYSYGATYPGYGQYPQQVECAPEVTQMVGAVPSMEHREETYDPLAIPSAEKLNAQYLAVHGNAMLGRHLWLKTTLP